MSEEDSKEEATLADSLPPPAFAAEVLAPPTGTAAEASTADEPPPAADESPPADEPSPVGEPLGAEHESPPADEPPAVSEPRGAEHEAALAVGEPSAVDELLGATHEVALAAGEPSAVGELLGADHEVALAAGELPAVGEPLGAEHEAALAVCEPSAVGEPRGAELEAAPTNQSDGVGVAATTAFAPEPRVVPEQALLPEALPPAPEASASPELEPLLLPAVAVAAALPGNAHGAALGAAPAAPRAGAASGEEPEPLPEASASAAKMTTEGVQAVAAHNEEEDESRVWRPRRNKCLDETDEPGSPWYKHKRHVIIFTFSGKPVYTRYGCEDGIVSTTGALSAIVSKMQMFFFATQAGREQDSLRYMLAGDHMFVFVERGPLWLTCVSSAGDTYPDVVRMLDRVHSQVITILTAGIEKTLTTRPNYDMRSLLGGTDNVVNSMIRWCTHDLQVDGLEVLPLAPDHRKAAVEALRSARVNNILCAFLMAGHRLIALVANRQYKVHAPDLQAVVNLIMSSASLRTGESWTPLCLPNMNDKAFAYAYISFTGGTDIGTVFLSLASDGELFYAISQHAATIKKNLHKSGCLDAVAASMERCPIDFRVAASIADMGARSGDRSGKSSLLAPCTHAQWMALECIIHAAYFVPSLQQYFSSAIAPAHRTRRRAKLLFRCYRRCRALLRRAKQPCQICIATDHECFYVFLAQEFNLYLTVPRGTSTGVIGQMYHWFKSQEGHVLLGATPTW